jgi:hypothetical protein
MLPLHANDRLHMNRTLRYMPTVNLHISTTSHVHKQQRTLVSRYKKQFLISTSSSLEPECLPINFTQPQLY